MDGGFCDDSSFANFFDAMFFFWPFVAYGAEGQVGIVLLHGKGDRAPYKVSFLAQRLRNEGYFVVTPEMPWSKNRMYDVPYEEAMTEIDAAVDQLKKDGAQKIIVGGFSLGGNAALGYGARRRNLSGLIILSPGHFPEAQKFREMSASDISRAKKLLAAGQINEKINFRDTNMGKTFTSIATVGVYLSYFDPQGPAAIRSALPVLWIVGDQDPLTRPGSYAFDLIPSHSKSQYLSVKAGHLETPDVAVEQIVRWIANLQNQ